MASSGRGATIEVKFVKPLVDHQSVVGNEFPLNFVAGDVVRGDIVGGDTIAHLQARIHDLVRGDAEISFRVRLSYACPILNVRYENMRGHGKVAGYNIVDGSVVECELLPPLRIQGRSGKRKGAELGRVRAPGSR